MIYHLVATARNGVIGKDNRLPWHFSADLKHFKKLTLGQTVVMGRKTFESLGKALPGRENFVVTRTPRQAGDHLWFFPSLEEAIQAVRTEHAFLIGGAQIYAASLDRIDGIFRTEIDADFEGDAFYPEIPAAFSREPGEILQEHPRLQVFFYRRRL